MSTSPAQLAALREMLKTRWPASPANDGTQLPVALSSFDEPSGGGLPVAALTEIVCSAPSCGGQLLLDHLLGVTRERRQRVALVDPGDCFDPDSHHASHLEHLVWARGGEITTALTVTDLFARDANLGLVILDIRAASARELRRVPAPLWYRLQRAVENTEMALVVFTPRALVPSSALRFELATSLPPHVWDQDRPELPRILSPQLHRQRHHYAVDRSA